MQFALPARDNQQSVSVTSNDAALRPLHDKVRAYLDAHPEAANLSVRNLVAIVEVNRNITWQVQREWKVLHGNVNQGE